MEASSQKRLTTANRAPKSRDGNYDVNYGSVTNQQRKSNTNVRRDLPGIPNKFTQTTAKNLSSKTTSQPGHKASKSKEDKSTSILPLPDRTAASCYFNDNLRKIDYVIVYEVEKSDENVQPINNQQPTGKDLHLLKDDPKEYDYEMTNMNTDDKHDDKEQHSKWRQKFFKQVKKSGLQLEEEKVETTKKTVIYYIKCHAPFEVLCKYAEQQMMKMPLQLTMNTWKPWSAKFLSKLHLPNFMSQRVPLLPPSSYNAFFHRSNITKFVGHNEQATFFKNRDRQTLVYNILASLPYGHRSRAEIGIDRLLHEKVIQAAFPLHDGPAEVKGSQLDVNKLNARQILHEYWARAHNWHSYQPLDHIRDYYGERIAFYFAWLGFYSSWLLPASIVGVLVFIYGLFSLEKFTPVLDVCNSEGKYPMCPLCDTCKFWNLSDSCIYTAIGYVCDNTGTVFYAVFISFWAACFLDNWKRTNATLAYHWDTIGFEEEEERPRPEFAAKCTTFAKNPITGIIEPYFSETKRITRVMSAIGIIIMMVCVVLIFVVGLIFYSITINVILAKDAQIAGISSTITSVSASVANLIVIIILGTLYQKLAVLLTKWEMHRTQSEYEDHLNLKVFVFQFVNFYSTVLYIAFFKGRFIGYPGNYTRLFGIRNEDCGVGGCLFELAEQLAIILIGKQILSNAKEIFIPKVMAIVQRFRMSKLTKKIARPPWETEYEDLLEAEPLLNEYLEMIIQYGFITLFVCAFPLAPLFALLNNWMEIRIDAQKFVCEYRRPVAERAEDIGIWFHVLETLTVIAVISNAALIAFTSEFIPRLMYQYKHDYSLVGYVNFTLSWSPNGTFAQPCRYRDYRDETGKHTQFYWELMTARLAFVVVFQNFVMGIARLVDIVIADVPEEVEQQIKRQRFLARQALVNKTDAEQIG